jgi:hypothetical protein
MRLHMTFVAVIALGLLGAAPGVQAAEQRLGLNEAIKIAWEGNPELRALRQALAAQQEGYRWKTEELTRRVVQTYLQVFTTRDAGRCPPGSGRPPGTPAQCRPAT